MFGRKKSVEHKTYDIENEKPILRCSICNGEQVAGFRNIHTGEFREIGLIRNDAELWEFLEEYGLEKITKEY
jgi:hypothetical protein